MNPENSPYVLGGVGALAGAGLGLLTSKKKGRGALLGALLGAGLGGGLGYANNYFRGANGGTAGEDPDAPTYGPEFQKDRPRGAGIRYNQYGKRVYTPEGDYICYFKDGPYILSKNRNSGGFDPIPEQLTTGPNVLDLFQPFFNPDSNWNPINNRIGTYTDTDQAPAVEQPKLEKQQILPKYRTKQHPNTSNSPLNQDLRQNRLYQELTKLLD